MSRGEKTSFGEFDKSAKSKLSEKLQIGVTVHLDDKISKKSAFVPRIDNIVENVAVPKSQKHENQFIILPTCARPTAQTKTLLRTTMIETRKNHNNRD